MLMLELCDRFPLAHMQDIPVNPIPPDLDFVLSGKLSRISLRELQVFQPALKVLKPKRNHRSKNSKSTAPAGHDEILGSTDTDFQYSQENLAPRLVTMLPSRKYQLRGDMNAVRRPLGAHNKPRQNSLLLEASPDSLHHWQIRATNEDIKEHLKFWARAVALAIRQEC
ncbi:hypothetical protein KP509_17G065400 [Ceratopteris richardii]|uniref:Uncharacterized protein n=1 Tax=Ceratopteris richardii TaxID=49495 RepID=A0A8T2SWW9_CERRI|nr:hypothetical protein KP509_17G065400 [Ceratopteris richardii]